MCEWMLCLHSFMCTACMFLPRPWKCTGSPLTGVAEDCKSPLIITCKWKFSFLYGKIIVFIFMGDNENIKIHIVTYTCNFFTKLINKISYLDLPIHFHSLQSLYFYYFFLRIKFLQFYIPVFMMVQFWSLNLTSVPYHLLPNAQGTLRKRDRKFRRGWKELLLKNVYWTW